MTSPHDDRLWRAHVNGLMLLASSNESRGEYDSALTTIQRAIELVEGQRAAGVRFRLNRKEIHPHVR
jgi:hypothetical protein